MRVRAAGWGLIGQKQAVGIPAKLSPESNINLEYNTAVISPLYHRYQK
jgi:hypothetical protein